MKTLIKLSLLLVLVVSCSKKEDELCCAPNDIGFEFSVVNQEYEDLLDKSTSNTLNTNAIKIYYIDESGNEILVNNPQSDHPNGYSIQDRKNKNFIMKVSFNDNERKNLKYSGIVQWNANQRDVISLELEQIGDKRILKKIKYNDKVVWVPTEENRYKVRHFTIVK